jgi:hypothetical protein
MITKEERNQWKNNKGDFPIYHYQEFKIGVDLQNKYVCE